MKPFSAIYFMKENIKRSVLLIFMFVLTFAIYMAGLYISNVESMFKISLERDRNTAIVNSMATDKNNEDFAKVVEMLEKDKRITVLHQGVYNEICTTAVMDFKNVYTQYSFRSKEDFETYCNFTGIKIQTKNKDKDIGNGSVIMSSLQADNRGMGPGGRLVEEDSEYTDQEYTLDAITDEDGYGTYYISDTNSASCLLLNNSMSDKEFKELLDKLETEYKVYARGYDYYKNRINEQLGNFYYIYFFIIILLSVIMAITINAAFAGLYQHRQGEFALYKAIGISMKKIRLKILSEVLVIDITGILAGVCVIMAGIYLFNNLYLIPRGLRLFYYNNMSMAGMVASNLIILVPVTLLQGRKLIKADICNY